MSDTIDFGIDLGTTNSLIAKFGKGSVEIFKNPTTWKDTTPSVVAFRNDRVLVGDTARTYQEKSHRQVVGLFKRKMGTTESFLIGASKETKSPVELSACVLKELKTFVPDAQTIDGAVITVPASFDVIQSTATREAAQEAGFRNIVLLQEPIAASLAYANQTATRDITEGKWLVYDLGGGTFDVALVSIKSGEMKILDHEGDNYLGGTDFDLLIAENIIVPHLSERFGDIDMAIDVKSASGKFNSLLYKMLHAAEEAKKVLSNKTSAEISFEFDDDDINIDITRSEFESLIKDTVGHTTNMVRTILTRNALTPSDLRFILMVGGSTYIPYVRSRVSELLDIPVKTDIDPTTAIVIGAAHYAGTKERESTDDLESKQLFELTVKAVFERVSRDTSEPFFARIDGDTTGLSYRIQRNDRGFDSGLRPLKDRIMEDLPLVKDSYNFFVFSIFDGENNRIPTNFSEFQVAHNLISVNGQPLPEDICIEIDDTDEGMTYLKRVFAKHTILPAKSQTITCTVTRDVPSGSLDEAIFINVLQGDSTCLPESAKHLGTLQVTGSELTRSLVKGTEVEISLEISESRQISVSAYIQQTDQVFKEVFIPENRNVQSEVLLADVQSLIDKLESNVLEAKRRDDSELLRELRPLERRLSDLEDRAFDLAPDDVTDAKFQIDDEKKKIAEQLNQAIISRQAEKLLSDYFEIKTKCQDLLDESGSERSKEQFQEATESEIQFIDPPSPALLKAKISELRGIYWSVMWRQPKFLADELNWYADQDFINESPESTKLIEQGQIAIIDNDFDSVRNIVIRLSERLPKERRFRRHFKTGIGIE